MGIMYLSRLRAGLPASLPHTPPHTGHAYTPAFRSERGSHIHCKTGSYSPRNGLVRCEVSIHSRDRVPHERPREWCCMARFGVDPAVVPLATMAAFSTNSRTMQTLRLWLYIHTSSLYIDIISNVAV